MTINLVFIQYESSRLIHSLLQLLREQYELVGVRVVLKFISIYVHHIYADIELSVQYLEDGVMHSTIGVATNTQKSVAEGDVGRMGHR